MRLSRWIAVLSLACTVVACDSTGPATSNPDTVTPDSGSDVENQISLTIDFGQTDKENVSHRVNHTAEMTVLDVLLQTSDAYGFKVACTGNGETAFVESIDGVFGGEMEDHWWIFRVNQKLANKGSGVYKLQPGDQIEWQLGNYE